MEPATRSKASTIAKTSEGRGRPACRTSSLLGRSAPLVSARVDEIAVEERLGIRAAGSDLVVGVAQEAVGRRPQRGVAAETRHDLPRRHTGAGTADATGGGAGHVGRSHAGAGDRVVAAALPGRQDADTR